MFDTIKEAIDNLKKTDSNLTAIFKETKLINSQRRNKYLKQLLTREEFQKIYIFR